MNNNKMKNYPHSNQECECAFCTKDPKQDELADFKIYIEKKGLPFHSGLADNLRRGWIAGHNNLLGIIERFIMLDFNEDIDDDTALDFINKLNDLRIKEG